MDKELKALIKFTIENDALMGIRNGNKVVVYNADSLADTILKIVDLRAYKHSAGITCSKCGVTIVGVGACDCILKPTQNSDTQAPYFGMPLPEQSAESLKYQLPTQPSSHKPNKP